MVMKLRKLISKSKSKPIRKTAREKMIQKQRTRKNRIKRKQYNKKYYRKNRRTILLRASKRRKRLARGDNRVTRRRTIM